MWKRRLQSTRKPVNSIRKIQSDLDSRGVTSKRSFGLRSQVSVKNLKKRFGCENILELDKAEELSSLYAAFHSKDELNVEFTYDELVSESGSIYSEMSICAVNVALNAIQLMDSELWEEVRLVYQQLKDHEVITTNDVNRMVLRIIFQLYGTNKVYEILDTFSKDNTRAVFQFGRYLLSTYNEAYEIVTETEKGLHPSTGFNSEFPKLNNPQSSGTSKNIVKKKPEIRYNTNKSSVIKGQTPPNSKKQCIACNANTRMQSKTNCEPLRSANKKVTKKDNDISKAENEFVKKTKDFSSGDNLVHKISSECLDESIDVHNNEISRTLSSEVQTESSMAFILKQAKSTHKKTRGNLTISIDQNELQEKFEEGVVRNISSKLQVIPSTIVANFNCSAVKQCIRNILIMVILAYYKNNLVDLTSYFGMAAKWLKTGLRDFLLMLLPLLET